MAEANLLESVVSWEIPHGDKVVKGYVQEDIVCLSRGTSVTICSPSCTSEIEFESDVDAIAWSSGWSGFLVVSTRSGLISFVSTSTHSTVLSQAVVQNDDMDQALFVCLQFTKEKLVLQMIDRILVLALRLQSGPTGTREGYLGELNCEIVSELDLRTETASSVMLISKDRLMFSGHDGLMLSVWQKMEGEYQVVDSIDHWSGDSVVVQCCETSCGTYIVLLTERGTLSVWHASLLIMVNIYAKLGIKVNDFTTYTRQVRDLSFSSGGGKGKIMDGVCALMEDEAGKVSLQLLNLPFLKEDYSMEVSRHAQLAHGITTEKNLYYLDYSNSSSSLQVIRLVQSLPEHRVGWLISNQQFSEALQFARDHNVDLELVYKSKARLLNQQLSCHETCSPETSEILLSLNECWENISDEAFIHELVFQFPYLNLDLTSQVLSGIQLETREMSSKVNSALNWLTTFKLILNGRKFSSEAWRTFYSTHTLDLIKECLAMGDLKSVFLLHERHTVSLVNELDELSVSAMLMCLPEWVESAVMEQWLSTHLLPLLLRYMPHILDDLVIWVMDRIKLLELREKDGWPANGLKVAESVLHSLSSFKAPASLQPHPLNFEIQLDKLPSMAELKCLRGMLADLVFLESSIKWLDITLSEYRTEPREVVVYRILDKLIATELVTDTLKSKVVPYLQRHGLNLDAVLLDYIKLFLDRMPSSWSSGPQEAKVIALIQAIKDVEIHVEACVELLHHVQSDWSEDVEELVHSCMEMGHASCANLGKQYSLLQLKKLLQSYDIRDFNFVNITQGRFYIRRILRHYNEKALQDALKVADMYHLNKSVIYKDYLMGLVREEKVEEAADVLECLPDELRLTTARAALTLASSKLNNTLHPNMDLPSERIADIQLALISLRCLWRSSKKDVQGVYWNGNVMGEEAIDLAATLDLYKRLLSLQVEFNLYLSPNDLELKERCIMLLKGKISETFTANMRGTTASRVNALTRFSHLLGVSQKNLYRCIGEKCLDCGILENIKEFCRTLMEMHLVDSNLFVRVVRHFWEHFHSSPESVTQDDVVFVQCLLSYLTSFCIKTDLTEAVDLYHFSSFFSSVYAVCTQMEGLDVMNESERVSVSSACSSRGHYVDDGMVLDQTCLLPSLAHYCLLAASTMPSTAAVKNLDVSKTDAHGQDDNEDTLISVAHDLSSVLEENSHTQLLIHCTISTLATLSQDVALRCLTGILTMSPEMATGQGILGSLITTLAEKVMCSSHVDHDYGLSLLLALPPSKVGQLMATIKTGRAITSYSRATALCQLALDFCSMMGDQSSLKLESQEVLKKAQWGQLLSRYKVSYTRAFRGGGREAKISVGKTLLLNTEVDVDTVVRFYKEELGQDVQTTLLQYLTTVLTQWEESYTQRAQQIMSRITSKKNIFDLFSNLLFAKVHPYDYPKITFILQYFQQGGESVSGMKTSQGLLVLDCLRNYKRLTAPTDFEKQWYQDHYMAQLAESTVSGNEEGLPPQASTCLPFHILLYGDNRMTVIKPEFSKATMAVLSAVARLIQLPMDEFYMSAIENIVVKSKPPEATDQQKDNQREEFKLLNFDELQPLLLCISDASLALNGARWLAKHLQGEENKRLALEAALKVALEGKDQARSEGEMKKASVQVGLLENMLAISQSERLLRQYSLDLDKYQGMTSHTLIMELFTDVPELSQKEPMPPLHEIAVELAKIYKVSLNKIKSKLCEQWLLSLGHYSSPLDSTMSQPLSELDESFGSAQDLPAAEDEDSLTMKRLVYLLTDPPKLEENIITLLKWAKNMATPISCLCRVRALQVLLAIASPTLIESVSGTSLQDVREFMQSALFVCELESLKVSMTLPAFIKCNKAGLIRTLWRHHANKPMAIRLVSELCLCHGLGDRQLWSKTLNQLLQLKMFPYLRDLLQRLASRPEIDAMVLTDVWRQCILQPLQSMSLPLVDGNTDDANESLKLLYNSPMPWKMAGSRVVELYDKLGLKAHALASLALCPEQQDKHDLVQQFLFGMTKDQVVHALGVKLPVGKEQVKGMIFTHLECQDNHEQLLGSKYFSQLVNFMISRKMINRLLRKCLRLEKYEEAMKLVELYNSVHSEPTTLTGKQALMEYVVNNHDFFQTMLDELQPTPSPSTT